MSKQVATLTEPGGWLRDPVALDNLYRAATVFARSELVPTHFRNKPDDCFIVLQFADRAGIDPFGAMQKTFVIHGKPGVEATLAIALLQKSGHIVGTVKYTFDGEGKDYGCAAVVLDRETGQAVVGPKITMQLAEKEGWLKKRESKWLTMPDLMFRYRAATWLIRAHYPGVLLGVHTVDELEDMNTVDSVATPRPVKPRSLEEVVANKLTDDQKAFGEFVEDSVAKHDNGTATEDELTDDEKAEILQAERDLFDKG